MAYSIKQKSVIICFSFFLFLSLQASPAQALDSSMPAIENPFTNLQVKIPGVDFSSAKQCPPPNEDKYCFNWIGEYIIGLYRFSVGIAGILAALTLMLGGFTWVMAGGNPDNVNKAKASIGAAVSGLIIMSASYLILNTINQQLVVFAPIGIKLVEHKELATGQQDLSRYSDCIWSKNQLAGTSLFIRGGSARKSVDSEICKTNASNQSVSEDEKKYCYCSYQALSGCEWLSTTDCTSYNKVNSPDDKCDSSPALDRRKCCCESEDIKFHAQNNCPVNLYPNYCKDCKDCVDAQDLEVRGTYNGTKKMSKAIANKMKTAIASYSNIIVTEAWPPSRQHSASCQYDGTCIDAALKDQSYTKENVAAAYNALKAAGARAVFETEKSCADFNIAGMECHEKTEAAYSHITGSHFSVY